MKTYKIITILLVIFLMLGSNLNAQDKRTSRRPTYLHKDPIELYEHRIKQQNQEINRLNKELEIQQKKLNNYYLDLIEIGSNFLFLPYNEYSIKSIAIPAISEARGYAKFEQYRGRLDLLQNYKKNLTEIGWFIQDYLEHTHSANGEWIIKMQKDFFSLKAVKDYQTLFGEGWEETFLGKLINNILLTFEGSTSKDFDTFRTYLQDYYAIIEPMMETKQKNESIPVQTSESTTKIKDNNSEIVKESNEITKTQGNIIGGELSCEGILKGENNKNRNLLSIPFLPVAATEKVVIKAKVVVDSKGLVVQVKNVTGGTKKQQSVCEQMAARSRWSKASGTGDSEGEIIFTITPKVN